LAETDLGSREDGRTGRAHVARKRMEPAGLVVIGSETGVAVPWMCRSQKVKMQERAGATDGPRLQQAQRRIQRRSRRRDAGNRKDLLALEPAYAMPGKIIGQHVDAYQERGRGAPAGHFRIPADSAGLLFIRQ